MERKAYPRVGESMACVMLENGLPVYVFPKPDYEKYYAFFATNYGGMDMVFSSEGKAQNTPAGVAHFLEHKLFDTEGGNALQDLAANGASPNAFTSNAITGYYFECTEKFEENLRILLSFVSVPYFTKESVDKEQGIIGQEIRMIEDDPNWQVFTNLLAALYEKHPVRVSVAGTAESISHITPETLYTCHGAFYTPKNMVLCVAGNVDPERVAQIAGELIPAKPGERFLRDYEKLETQTVFQREKRVAMEVSIPLFQLGCKADAPPEGEDRLRQRLIGELAWEALLGTSSPLYERLYSEGLVNSSFSYGYEDYPGCAFLAAGGESRDPDAVRSAVLAEASRIGAEGIDPGLWGRLKKGVYGNKVRSLNNFETLCVEQAQGHFVNVSFLDFPQVFDKIKKEDAEDCVRSWMTAERMALSVVAPKGERA